MPFSPEHLAELNLLALFDSQSQQAGIKVHSHQAAPEAVAAAERADPHKRASVLAHGAPIAQQVIFPLAGVN